jgi:hypothetical protein
LVPFWLYSTTFNSDSLELWHTQHLDTSSE